jgi:uncharacterized spore protein YtfJ
MQAAGGAAGAPQPRVEQPSDGGGAAAGNLLPAAVLLVYVVKVLEKESVTQRHRLTRT